MKPAVMLLATALCLVSLVAGAQESGQLQYDPKIAAERERRANAEFQTSNCMNESIRAALQQGIRDRSTIAVLTLRFCGGLITQIMRSEGRPEKEISDELKILFDSELEVVTSQGQ